MRKIFCVAAEDPKIIGIAAALQAQPWHNSFPLFDVMVEHEPDMFLLRPEDMINNDAILAQKEFPNTRFIFLKNEPDVSSSSYNHIETLNLWEIPYLASTTLYGGGQPDRKFDADISVFSDSLNEGHVDWISDLFEDFTVKIYGSKKLITPLYLGRLDRQEYKTALASSSMNLVFDSQWEHNALLNNCHPIIYGPQDSQVGSPARNLQGVFDDGESLKRACQYTMQSIIEKRTPICFDETMTYEFYVKQEMLC